MENLTIAQAERVHFYLKALIKPHLDSCAKDMFSSSFTNNQNLSDVVKQLMPCEVLGKICHEAPREVIMGVSKFLIKTPTDSYMNITPMSNVNIIGENMSGYSVDIYTDIIHQACSKSFLKTEEGKVVSFIAIGINESNEPSILNGQTAVSNTIN